MEIGLSTKRKQSNRVIAKVEVLFCRPSLSRKPTISFSVTFRYKHPTLLTTQLMDDSDSYTLS